MPPLRSLLIARFTLVVALVLAGGEAGRLQPFGAEATPDATPGQGLQLAGALALAAACGAALWISVHAPRRFGAAVERLRAARGTWGAGLALLTLCALAALRWELPLGRTTLRVLLVLGLGLWAWRAPPPGQEACWSERGWARLWWATLALAAGVRLAMVAGFPLPFCDDDTSSYFGCVEAWSLGRAEPINPERTPLYPLFAWVSFASGSLVLHTLLAHAGGLGAAWWAGRALRRRWGEVSGYLVFCALALTPLLVYYEHFARPEGLYVICLTAAGVLALEELGAEDGGAGRGALLGAWSALGVLARPVALALPPLLLLAALGRRWRLRRLAALAVGLAVPLLLWCGYNRATHGFFGLTSIGTPAAFGAFGHLIDPDSEGFEELKRRMAPALRAHAARRPDYHPDFNWLVYDPEGPLVLSQDLLPPPERARILRALLGQALRRHPGAALRRCLYQSWLYLIWADRTYVPPAAALAGERHHPSLALTPQSAGLWETPLARALGRLPGGRIHDLGASLPTRVYGLLPWELFMHPLLALALLVGAWWLPPGERLAVWALVLAGVATMGAVCVLSIPFPRYHLQTAPLFVAAAVPFVSRWARGPAGEYPGDPPASAVA
ncbi:MAG: hypothetical protein AB7N76_33935 [Planctomycetota bacterium]